MVYGAKKIIKKDLPEATKCNIDILKHDIHNWEQD